MSVTGEDAGAAVSPAGLEPPEPDPLPLDTVAGVLGGAGVLVAGGAAGAGEEGAGALGAGVLTAGAGAGVLAAGAGVGAGAAGAVVAGAVAVGVGAVGVGVAGAGVGAEVVVVVAEPVVVDVLDCWALDVTSAGGEVVPCVLDASVLWPESGVVEAESGAVELAVSELGSGAAEVSVLAAGAGELSALDTKAVPLVAGVAEEVESARALIAS